MYKEYYSGSREVVKITGDTGKKVKSLCQPGTVDLPVKPLQFNERRPLMR